MYGIVNIIIEQFLDSQNHRVVYYATIIYFSGAIGLLLGSLFKLNFRILLRKLVVPFSTKYIFIGILLGLLLIKSMFLYNNGLLFRPSILLENDRNDLFEINQFWVVSSYLISGLFINLIFFINNHSKWFICLLVFLFLYYLSLNLSIGNRREITPIILAGAYLLFKRKQIRLTISNSLLIGIFLFIYMFIGVLRDVNVSNLEMADKISLTLVSNEFVYPFYTLTTNLGKYFSGDLQLLYGKSLLIYPFTIFIPRIFFPYKQQSLGSDFVQANFGGGQGYAFMPTTEFFINFGIVGPLVGLFFVSLIFNSVSDKFKITAKEILLFSLIPDLCRGEISGFVYQLFFVSIFFFIKAQKNY